VGRRRVKSLIAELATVPSFDEAPDLYRDWGDPRIFTIGDIGTGECAGEVISPTEFAFAESERFIFEAQLSLDENDVRAAASHALAAMVCAARAVCLPIEPSLGDGVDVVGPAFDRLLGDTGLFDAASPGGRFSRHFVHARKRNGADASAAAARQRIEEAQLFVDAAHAYLAKAEAQPAAAREEVPHEVGSAL